MDIKYNKHNFHKYTFCEFQEVSFSDIENIKPSYKSKSGSVYYFSNEGVFRVSNHWGRAANCRWRMLSDEKIKSQTQKCGFAKWTDFYPNDETEKLFYIEVNWETEEVIFQHKSNFNYKNFFVLRNASATAKRIQTIKEVLKNNIEKIIGERKRLTDRINELPFFEAHPSQTNFVLVEVGSKENSDLVYNNLLKQGILVQTVSDPIFSTSRYFLRITVGNREENDILIKGLENVSKNNRPLT